jgi:hypothetical protein
MRIAYHHIKKPLTDLEQDQYPPSTVLFVGGIRQKTTAGLRDIFARWKPVSARVGTLGIYFMLAKNVGIHEIMPWR